MYLKKEFILSPFTIVLCTHTIPDSVTLSLRRPKRNLVPNWELSKSITTIFHFFIPSLLTLFINMGDIVVTDLLSSQSRFGLLKLSVTDSVWIYSLSSTVGFPAPLTVHKVLSSVTNIQYTLT